MPLLLPGGLQCGAEARSQTRNSAHTRLRSDAVQAHEAKVQGITEPKGKPTALKEGMGGFPQIVFILRHKWAGTGWQECITQLGGTVKVAEMGKQLG